MKTSKKKKSQKTFPILLLLPALAVFLFSAWQLARIGLEYWEGRNLYQNLSDAVVNSAAEQDAGAADPVSSAAASEDSFPSYAFLSIDFPALEQQNPDTVGWIFIEDTRISYPVVQSNDNEWYMTHLFDGSVNKSGSIFLDCRNSADFSDRHSIIYGHRMKNGTMFAGLRYFDSQAYYDAHPYFMLMTPDQNYIVEIFSVYIADVNGDSWKLDFTEEEFETWLKKAERNSCIDADFTPTADDRIITLSTCTGTSDDVRLVVHGRIADTE